MNCSKCNNVINEGQEVCLSCGHILGYESEASKKCIHCNREIPQAYKKCPYCKKKQKRKRYLLKFIIIVIIMLINIRLLTIMYSSEVVDNKTTYKEDCKQVEVVDLIDNHNKYIDDLVTLEGTVTNVEKASILFNRVKITLKVDNQKVYIYYNNKDEVGYSNGTNIKIYGKFKNIEGNKPIINAKYVIKNTD